MNAWTGTTVERGRELAEIAVGDVMQDGVLRCRLETPLREVARIMALNRIHCVVACDDPEDCGESLWGIVSDLDLVAAVSAGDVAELTAGSAAVTPVLTIAPSESLLRAGQLMAEHEITHLVVVDPVAGTPLGVLSTLDIARAVADVR